jgi:hypothetical protein
MMVGATFPQTAGGMSLIDEVGNLAVFFDEKPVNFVHASLYVWFGSKKELAHQKECIGQRDAHDA